MWITSLGIWAREGCEEAFPVRGMPSAANSVPSDPNKVTLLELLGLVSCLSERGATRALPLAEHKQHPSLWGARSCCHWSFSWILWVAECTCERLSPLTAHWTCQATRLLHWLLPRGFEGTQEMQSAPYRIALLGNIWSFFSGNLCAWIENHLFQFVLRTDTAYTHFLYL